MCWTILAPSAVSTLFRSTEPESNRVDELCARSAPAIAGSLPWSALCCSPPIRDGMAAAAACATFAGSTPSWAAIWSMGSCPRISSTAEVLTVVLSIRWGWWPVEPKSPAVRGPPRVASESHRLTDDTPVGGPGHRGHAALFPGAADVGHLRRQHSQHRGELVVAGVAADHGEGRVRTAHSGMFPCFFGGIDSRLVRRSRRARITDARVSCGWMTWSM